MSSLTADASAQITSAAVDTPVHLDGSLSEKAWERAQVIADFTQRELTEGAAPTERTEVRIIHDSGTFYVGVKCFDSEPDRIIHKELKWDTNSSSDDKFAVVIDTYHDKRQAFAFAVNANGARDDGTLLSDQSVNYQWDGIWEVASRITDFGWSFEMAIPFKTLRFPTTEMQDWGINFVRVIARKHEELEWRGWRREEGVTHLASAGTIVIPGRVTRGRQLDAIPYVLAGEQKQRLTKVDDIFKYGLDVKYGVSSNTTLVLTTKTDFAQIESDKDVINLTRFPIQYPEKRDFFLEGLETFDFTQGGTKLFYSRKIGIDPVTREAIPILGGAKLTQKQGGYRLGLLNVQTQEQGNFPSTNYTVVRVRRDILVQSYIGFIATSVLDMKHHDNQVLGMDFGYKTDKFLGNKNFEIQGYLTGSANDGVKHDNLAGRVYFYYPNDLINWYGLYHALDKNFNPGIGFASRVGIKNYIWQLQITPRPNIPHIKKLVFKPFDINYTTGMDGTLQTRNDEIRPLGIQFKSGDNLDFKIWNKYDFIDKPDGWVIFKDPSNKDPSYKGTVVPKGVYKWWYSEIAYTGSRTRPVALDFNANLGDHYNGTRTYLSSSLSFKRTKYYSLSADVTYNDISIGESRFTTREYGSHIGVDINTRLSSSVFIQYNNASRLVTTNFRIHYIPKVGSDIYLVYNNIVNEQYDYRAEQNAAMLKFDYTYQF
ncbi:MAG: DUF5916 domain-containing protein [Candidatus Latescibacter sp.]|nr:DUF5916 domain-containing protein [Candidatus Latescibacter sp.]